MKHLPNDLNAEKTVLGSIMTSEDDYISVRDILTKESFFDIRNQQIYEAIRVLHSRADKCDMLTVNNELQRNGVIDLLHYLIEVQSAATFFNVYQHAAIIHDKAVRRNFFTIAKELEKNAYSEVIDIVDVVNDLKKSIDGIFVDNTDTVLDMKSAVSELMDQMNKNSSGNKELTGMPTLYNDFDKKSGGLQESDLVIIAAETSQGKTSLALNICSNISEMGFPCAIYSMEMSSRQITAKLAAKDTGLPTNTLLYFPVKDFEFKQFDAHVSKLCNKPIYIDQKSTSNIDRIISSIRSMHTKFGIKLVMVDYLQMISTNDKKKSREEMTAESARLLKNIAKELGICVIALSQLSRDKENPRPTISRLRNSGQIEEAADTIMLLYRPEIYQKQFPDPFDNIDTRGMAMIDVAKGRTIGIFKFLLSFNDQTQVFSEQDDYNEQQPKSKELPF